MAKTYRLTTIADLLAVPADRRGACFRDLEYGLAMLDLAAGDGLRPTLPDGLEWTDDNNHSVTLDLGDDQLTLEVSEERDA